MSGGILALFGACLGATVLEIALPDEDKNGPKQFLRFFTALLVLVLILEPVLSFIKNTGEELTDLPLDSTETVADFEQELLDAVAARSRVELERGLYELLAREFALEEAQCTVAATLDESGALVRIDVRLRGSGLFCDPQTIENRLKELFACETEVR